MERFSHDCGWPLEDVMCPVLVWPFLELGEFCALILQNQFLFFQFLFYLFFISFILTDDWKQYLFTFSSLIASFLLCDAYLWCFLLFYDSLKVFFHFQHIHLFDLSFFSFSSMLLTFICMFWVDFFIHLHVFSFKSLVLLEVEF